MSFGSINMSDIEIKPSAKGDFLENYHKSKRKTNLIEC